MGQLCKYWYIYYPRLGEKKYVIQEVFKPYCSMMRIVHVCDKMKWNLLHCYHVVSTRARYPRTHEHFQLHQFPSRVQLLLDFENVFTRASRKGVRSVLSQRFPHLLRPMYAASSTSLSFNNRSLIRKVITSSINCPGYHYPRDGIERSAEELPTHAREWDG